MKKLIILFIAVMLASITLSGQNSNKARYVYNFAGGITVGGDYATNAWNVKIDSITIQAGRLRIMSGATLQKIAGHVLEADTGDMLNDYISKQKIISATSATSVTGAELIPIVQGGVTKSVTASILSRNKGEGVFNVLNYGATSGDGTGDDDNIQLAIDAAYTFGGVDYGLGAVVLIPAGSYYLNAPMVLKSNVEVRADQNAKFSISDSFVGDHIWESDSVTFHATLSGGYYFCRNTTSPAKTFYKDYKSTDEFFNFNMIHDIHIDQANIVFDFYFNSTGWASAGHINNIFCKAKAFLNEHHNTGSLVNGISGFNFSNISFQTWADSTYSIIDTLYGEYNSFNNFMVYDWDRAIAGSSIVYLASVSSRNIISMPYMRLATWTDVGWNNTIISSGMIYTQPKTFYSTAGEAIGSNYIGEQMIYGSNRPYDITDNPQIPDGFPGQRITIIGISDVNTVTLDDGNGLSLAGQCVLGLDDTITLTYNKMYDKWIEISRSNN